MFAYIQDIVAQKKYDSYKGLVMAGYQGWFNTPDDGANRGWYHYKSKNGFKPGSSGVDFWADVSEYPQIYRTEFKHKDGSPAYTFSSHDFSTVDLHFNWMKEYGLDGVFMQRFVGEIKNPSGKAHFNKVLASAIESSTKYERAISIMYDLSGMKSGDELVILNDIDELNEQYQFQERVKAPSYLFHNQKPLVVLWGIGFNDKRAYGLKEAETIVEGLKKRGYSIMLGVPTYWRELRSDTENNEKLHQLIKKSDIVMPWFVSRYNEESYDSFKSLIEKDIKWCKNNKVDYAPLCFPGFSWENLKGKGSFYIDRNSGSFFWKQLSTVLGYGAEMIYVAMFDEIDEGTAIFKCARRNETPLNGNGKFEGIEDNLPSDYYLWLTGQAGKMLKKEIEYSKEKPIRLAENPFIKHMYTADPSAHVWSDGRLYVYASHDIAPPRGCDLMDQYHVFSTDDMLNWIDHGEILRATDVSWGRPEGGFMWAPDCAYKNGTYYFYFPHPSGTEWNKTWKVGIATSKKPTSDFVVQGYLELGNDNFAMIDPCVFVDDDGQSYFYYGGGDRCAGAKLKDNMVELAQPLVFMEGLTDFHEATWVFKRNGIYYLTYADNHRENGKGSNRLNYATSNTPLGPWTYRGIYLEPTGCDTSHGSVVEYKGQWYAFYHNMALSGRGNLRSICVDKLDFNPDGTIEKVEQTGNNIYK
ncbi:family 43 glycosylhydrolase [Dysgonomonas sp. HGC4]|nr:family 43 glycosylhydrolase [Dysgonomonas sp. HGC4]